MDKTLDNGQEEFEIAIKKHLQGLEHEFIGHLGGFQLLDLIITELKSKKF